MDTKHLHELDTIKQTDSNPRDVHGHEVMQMMIASGKRYSRESLREEIEQTFGPQARFFTCSGSGMTADELITVLEAKGKFHATKDGFTTHSEAICNH